MSNEILKHSGHVTIGLTHTPERAEKLASERNIARDGAPKRHGDLTIHGGMTTVARGPKTLRGEPTHPLQAAPANPLGDPGYHKDACHCAPLPVLGHRSRTLLRESTPEQPGAAAARARQHHPFEHTDAPTGVVVIREAVRT